MNPIFAFQLRNSRSLALVAALSVCLGIGILGTSSGCEKSSVPQSAAYVKNAAGLMPATTPRFDPTFVSNPADAKVLPERTISYQPLDTFRTANAEKLSKADGGGEEEKQAAKGGKRPRKKSGRKGVIGAFTSGLLEGVMGKAPESGGDESADSAESEEEATEEDAEEEGAEEEDASEEASAEDEEGSDEESNDADSEEEESGDDEEPSDEESEDEDASDDDSEDEESGDESEDTDEDEDAEP